MKHKHTIACICYAMICMASCQNQSEELPYQTVELPMSVVAHIGEATAIQGRYAGDTPNSISFANKDSIGIFVDEDSVICWNYNGESWIPEEKAYWPDKDNLHTFRAFYPYSKATSYTNIPMPDLKKQDGTMESLSRCDFLIATTQQKYGENGVVSFNTDSTSFQHASSLVQLQFMNAEDLTTATLNKISIIGKNITAPTTYSFTNGVELSSDHLDTLTITPNRSMTQGAATFYLIVNEKNDSSEVTLSLEYTVNEQTYIAQKSGFSNNTFKSGMQQNFKITVKNKTLSITGSTIADWKGNEELEDIIIDDPKQES